MNIEATVLPWILSLPWWAYVIAYVVLGWPSNVVLCVIFEWDDEERAFFGTVVALLWPIAIPLLIVCWFCVGAARLYTWSLEWAMKKVRGY